MLLKLEQDDDSTRDIVSADVLKVLIVNSVHVSTLTFTLKTSKSYYTFS